MIRGIIGCVGQRSVVGLENENPAMRPWGWTLRQKESRDSWFDALMLLSGITIVCAKERGLHVRFQKGCRFWWGV